MNENDNGNKRSWNGLTLKVVGLSESEWFRAHSVAAKFLAEFPDRIGFRNGCVYSRLGSEDAVYVYRTATQIIVKSIVERNDERAVLR